MNESSSKVSEFFKNIPIPDVIKYNAITALSKGIGKIIEGAFDIPSAYLENKAKIIRAKGDAEVKIITAASDSAANLFKTDSQLANRALNRFGQEIIESQINREKIAAKAMNHLQSMEVKEEVIEKINDDWLTIFWNLSSTKSSEEVQEILAKILSKEIVKPKSVSPNTLNLLSVLTSDLGNALSRLSNLSIDDGKSCYVIHPNIFPFQNIGPLDDYDVSYDDLFELDGAGLIRSAEALMLNYAAGQPEFELVNYAGLKADLSLVGAQVYLIQFTKSGRELRNLIDLTENKVYTQKLKEKLKDSFTLK
jgi:vacuolar-type H+-ATPase subunit E/Vma4